jgi:hypothetical protein
MIDFKATLPFRYQEKQNPGSKNTTKEKERSNLKFEEARIACARECTKETIRLRKKYIMLSRRAQSLERSFCKYCSAQIAVCFGQIQYGVHRTERETEHANIPWGPTLVCSRRWMGKG